ncbi:hypothetical protein C8J56DRAFT_960157 [Mycena floridula]|nr:hypothetical protein C8J56DRAFT_960157 [Mycena floridula]
MDQFPVEIWNAIFSLACMDDGTTGRSLSLVSKFVRESSKLVKLQSLAVVGYKQLLDLASLLEATEPSLRHVKYIFISPQSSRTTASDPKALNIQYASREAAYNAFERILCAISSTVEVIHAFFIFYREFPLLPVSLPHLEELSLHGPLEGAPSIDTTVQFPALQHLHLASFCSPAYLQQMITLTPALMHLRISAPDHSQTFVTELKAALESDNPLPETIEKLFVHQPIEPNGKDWTNPLIESNYADTMVTLNQLEKEHARMILLPPLRFGLFRAVPIQDAESAWLESISGPGWWSR